MKRSEAQILGLKTYTTGMPCKNGHLSYRYTNNGSCAECINGASAKRDPKTFLDKANELKITALSVYNEGLKMITAHYENQMKMAEKLELEAVKQQQIQDEAQMLLQQKSLIMAKKTAEVQAQQERKAALKRMVTVNVFIHPDDKFEVKDGILQMTQRVCPHITLDDINHKNIVRGGVLYTLRCFPEHKDEILSVTNGMYNARNVVPTPQ